MSHPAARVSARLAEADFYEGHLAEAIARLEAGPMETLFRARNNPDGEASPARFTRRSLGASSTR